MPRFASAASGVTMLKEMTMKTSMKLALAFLAFAGLAAGAAFAAGPETDAPDGPGGPDGQGGPRTMMRFERMDVDDSGDVTFEEFTAMFKSRIGDADANKDGKMTVEEIATQIERMRAERMARRLIERFDIDGDGALTAAEVESRQKKMFALMDRNDDGKIEKDEMPRHGGRWGRRWGPGGWGHGGGWGGDRW
jgi:Ca2+-binding EF-hand superfamily protein